MQGPVRISELNPNVKAQIIRNGKKGFSEGRPVTTVEQAHVCTQFVLKELGSPWPSVEDMRKSARSEWTIAGVKHRIAELKREHRQQLANAIKYQEHHHAQMVADDYLAFDNITYSNLGTDFGEELKSFLRMEHHIQTHQSDDFVSSLRYSHILALKPLYEKLQRLLMLEEKAKQQRARRFPKTSQGWREMDTRDAKLKIAKFLLMDKKKQDEMILRETDWRADMADIDMVRLEFKQNIMFSVEVQNFVKESQTTDPRRRG